MNGWFKLHRELMYKPIWVLSTPEQKTILITLLMMANHDRKVWEWKGEKYVCQPGQMITSLKSIAEIAGNGISIKNVRTAIERFEKYEFLANESTNKNRLITICNWDTYQSEKLEGDKQTGKQPASSRQLTRMIKNNIYNNIYVESNDSPEELSFDNVWNLYGKKGNKKTSKQRWNKLPISKKKLAIVNIPLYVQATPDKQFRKDFQAYINQEVWNDEILIKQAKDETETTIHRVGSLHPALID